jgi:hypothetical protein
MKGVSMFVIEMDDQWLLDDFASFLEYKLPGRLTRHDTSLTVTVDGTLAPRTQERILRRLLWAWQVERKLHLPAPLRLTYVERTPAEHT